MWIDKGCRSQVIKGKYDQNVGRVQEWQKKDKTQKNGCLRAESPQDEFNSIFAPTQGRINKF